MRGISKNPRLKFVYANSMQDKESMAEIAIDAHLWVEDWNLVERLSKMSREPDDNQDIILVYHGKNPIAVSVYIDRHVQFFVQEEYRRKGIASRLAKTWLDRPDSSMLYAGRGTKESLYFFWEVGIRVGF